MAKLLYQGHSSFRLTTAAGKVIYIDPFAGEGYKPLADLIVITHEHYDHNDVSKVPTAPRTIIIRSADALNGGVYRNFDYCGCHIQAVPAYNEHHDRSQCVGYLIDVDGARLYFAGDTSYTDYMPTLGKMAIDYAMLPIDGVFNMFPGDEGDVRIAYRRNGQLFGEVAHLNKSSGDRIEPRCKICSACGGCCFQQYAYSAQLLYKQKKVQEQFRKVGHLEVSVLPTIGMNAEFELRKDLGKLAEKGIEQRIILARQTS